MFVAFLDYDDFALAYAERTRDNAYNALYERPQIRALLPLVPGRRVLDAGCAAGEHTLWLRDLGADVTALDISGRMVALTKARLGDDTPVLNADLEAPLPFEAATFDVILSSLALHYVADLGATLREFARVLVPGGTLVFSTHHPMLAGSDGDYFTTRLIDEAWDGFGEGPVRVRWYHRSLESIVHALRTAHFALDAIREPEPDPAMAHSDAKAYLSIRRLPPFLFVRAHKPH
jgi:SAM-dependent methyltransferase